ncbi:hypothetical protein [Natrialba sp. PRR66]|uniref:hypothetical protein n=1 Tax=Natrialba sp. PRR66 TaxID=3098146 RepID=UPI002B1CF368|nr:hypothetical protein [Natrialba sp. PRR66]
MQSSTIRLPIPAPVSSESLGTELSQRGENLLELPNGYDCRRFHGDMLAEIGRLADERDLEYPVANE